MGLDSPIYDLYYVPEFPISSIRFRRDGRDKALAAFIDTMERHIAKFGLLNPLGVHIRASGTDVRPGKCRVTALQRLGRLTAPAIVADYTRAEHPLWQPLPYDAAEIQKFFTRDCAVEVHRRSFCIKKHDVVHRPGVENEFDRDLRLSKP